MRRCIVILLLVAVSVALTALPAAAADPDDVAADLELRGYYLEPGTSIDFDRMERLVDDSDATARRLYFVALSSDPAGGSDRFAEDVLVLLGEGTVVVLSPGEIGVRSTVFDDAAIDAAIDDAYDVGDDVEAFAAFAGALSDAPVVVPEPVSAGEPADGGGGGGGFVFLLIIVGIIALIGFTVWRNSRKDRAVVEGRLDEAKAELGSQLDAIANEILDLSDRVTVAENDRATELFRQANETYSAVAEEAQTAGSLNQLEELSDRLDRTRWQLEAAEALIEGREVPPEPEDRPAHCFFDPSHRAGVEEAEIRTPAGSKQVGVCRDCAEKLRRGETPTPRSINVGGRPVPAPQAPRSYGGGGMDWLGAFSILLGGLGRGVTYDLGRSGRSGRGGMGGLGGLSRLGRRSTMTSGTSSSRRSSRPSRPSRPRPRMTGRGRRRRK